uniref:Uncharacterized protein n=1 Tax=viral metagenome TaxID=1070528 RepID=A0A6C0LMQ1_9ZZZZ
MASQYDNNKTEIVRNITAQKAIYKYRIFMYSLNKDIRQQCFRITKEFLDNEYHNNTTITATERERLLNLGNHWQWAMFENESTNWWSALSFNHSKSLSLMTVIHMWIDDITVFDSEGLETSTLGIR